MKKIFKITDSDFISLIILFFIIFSFMIFLNHKADAMIVNKIKDHFVETEISKVLLEIKKQDNSPKITMEGLEPDNIYYYYYLNEAIKNRLD